VSVTAQSACRVTPLLPWGVGVRRAFLSCDRVGAARVYSTLGAVAGVAGGPRLLQDATYALAFFLVHVGLGLWTVLTLSLKQAITPIYLLGRVNASLRLISYGLGALGAALAGFLGMALGLRPTLWLSAGGFIVILALTLLATPLPRVRSLPIPTGGGRA
jgi:hypothetical protein